MFIHIGRYCDLERQILDYVKYCERRFGEPTAAERKEMLLLFRRRTNKDNVFKVQKEDEEDWREFLRHEFPSDYVVQKGLKSLRGLLGYFRVRCG